MHVNDWPNEMKTNEMVVISQPLHSDMVGCLRGWLHSPCGKPYINNVFSLDFQSIFFFAVEADLKRKYFFLNSIAYEKQQQ